MPAAGRDATASPRADFESCSPKSFELLRSGLRGGFTERSYRIVFPEKTLNLMVRAAMDGKLEQYQISE
jgi:hypothetical protein